MSAPAPHPLRLAALAAALALAAAAAPASAADAQADARLQQEFLQAGQAYDAGQFAEAARQYEDILNRGHATAEVFFNLGNARFKAGQVGPAVLSFRRAWMLAPRDADVAANLRFIQQAVSAPPPRSALPARLLARLSLREWTAVAVAGWWGAAALAGAALLVRRRRPQLARAAAAALLVAAAGAAGIGRWLDLTRSPEMVIATPAQALFAPLDGSTPHFALPAGSIVRRLEVSGAWIKVGAGPDTGWIPAANALAVYPWHSRGGS